MPASIALIIDGFVQLQDRKALEDLIEHRRELRNQLREMSNGFFDPIPIVDADIAAIESGLARLRTMTDS